MVDKSSIKIGDYLVTRIEHEGLVLSKALDRKGRDLIKEQILWSSDPEVYLRIESFDDQYCFTTKTYSEALKYCFIIKGGL